MGSEVVRPNLSLVYFKEDRTGIEKVTQQAEIDLL
jgi:hypothetical protein